jgi:ABC-type phosphate/phosphonate transport system substrate-binding protein
MKNKVSLPYLAFAGLALIAVLAGACSPAATAAPTVAPTVAAPTTAPATAAATAAATTAAVSDLGTAAHPIIMALAPSATTDALIASGNKIADLLSTQTGLTIKAVVPTNYQALIQAMCSKLVICRPLRIWLHIRP